MSLKDIWLKDADQIKGKTAQQIISFAGKGKLLDDSETSKDFRDLLTYVPFSMIKSFALECLEKSFENSGLALQDIVNEIGRRLGYEVELGRYRGVSGKIGFDGLWKSNDGHVLVIEVKTTDTYALDLETSISYRKKLVAENKFTDTNSSVLIVLGRDEKGNLEEQVRGSRYAWDIRIISVEALIKLAEIIEGNSEPRIQNQIFNILKPREYTKLDGIVDLVFNTVEVIKEEEKEEIENLTGADKKTFDSKESVDNLRDDSIIKLQKYIQKPLVQHSFARFETEDHSVGVMCLVSKEYIKSGRTLYWYAFHPHQQTALLKTPKAYISFVCGSVSQILVIDFKEFEKWLSSMNQTVKNGRSYWHVHVEKEDGEFRLIFKKGERIKLNSYLLKNV